MAQIISNAHLDIVIDGSHRVVGYADEDRPYEFGGGEDMFNLQRSQSDGGLYGTANAGNILGGPFTLRLQPTSPTAQWLIARKQELKRALQDRGDIRYHAITLKDQVQGRSTRMEGCVLQACPDQVEANQTFEVMFECELIESNNDGATFRPPFDSGTASAGVPAG